MSRLFLIVGLALGTLGLLLPASATDSVRGTVQDVLLPGQQLLSTLRNGFTRELTSVAAAETEPSSEAERWKRTARAWELHARTNLANGPEWMTAQVAPTEPLLNADLVPASIVGRIERTALSSELVVDAGADDDLTPGALLFEYQPLLDQGKNASLSIGLPVLMGRGVVGKLAIVGQMTSRLQTVTHPEFRAHVRLMHSTSEGMLPGPEAVLQGTGEPLCRLEYVDVATDIKPGDLVFAAEPEIASGAVYGRVTTATRREDGSGWEIEVEPAVDPQRLSHLVVLRHRLNDRRLADNEPDEIAEPTPRPPVPNSASGWHSRSRSSTLSFGVAE